MSSTPSMDRFLRDRYTRVKVSEAGSYVGEASMVKGDYWENCPEEEVSGDRMASFRRFCLR